MAIPLYVSKVAKAWKSYSEHYCKNVKSLYLIVKMLKVQFHMKNMEYK